MTTTLPSDIPFLYFSQDDLYRLGNAASSRLDHVRPKDVNTYERNGIEMVIADGIGISLYTELGVPTLKGGWLWKLPRGLQLPNGLALHNNHGAHYMICPARDMSMDGYKALLNEIALRCVRVRKV